MINLVVIRDSDSLLYNRDLQRRQSSKICDIDNWNPVGLCPTFLTTIQYPLYFVSVLCDNFDKRLFEAKDNNEDDGCSNFSVQCHWRQ